MKKDTVFFELQEHMAENRCPICSLINKRIRQAMDAFLYESVNDLVVRRKLKESRGMCNYHARKLMEAGDPIAHAIIYRDLIEQAKEDISSQRADMLMPYTEHKGCYFCKSARDSEDIYIKCFWDAFSDEDFVQKYMDGGMLCLAHLQAILVLEKRGSAASRSLEIARATMKKYDILQNELSEIIRKNDYRYAGEQWTDSQKTAWKRAVEVINDIAGIRK